MPEVQSGAQFSGLTQPKAIGSVPTAPTASSFQPLSPEQYASARKAGFSHDQIVQNEQRRKTESTPQTPVAPQTAGDKAVGFVKGATDFLFPAVGDVANLVKGTNTKSPLQIAGDVALTALPFVPGLGEAGILAKGAKGAVEGAKVAKEAGLISRVASNPIAKNAALGYGAGVASNLSQGEGAGESLLPNINTVGGAVTGGALGGLLGRVGGGSSALKKAAEKNISDVLAPTTKVNKQITQKIAPELAQKTPIALTKQSLLGKYEALQDEAGQKLETAYEALPSDAKFEVTNLFDSLQKKIDGYAVNGVVPSDAVSSVEALQTKLKDLANLGVEVSPDGTQVFADVKNVRQLRQIIDEAIQKSKKNFSPSDLDSARLAAQKQVANSIRDEFGKQYPDIAKLNKEYSFWSKAAGVLGDTLERKTGQTGIVRKMGEGVLGAIAGTTTGHPIIGAALWSGIGELVHSPAWKTIGALTKSKLAKALEAGDEKGISKILQESAKAVPVVGSIGTQGFLNNYVNPGQEAR